MIVLKINSQKVKLGLAAPQGVAIHRKEIGDGEPQATGAFSESDPQHWSLVEDVAAKAALAAPDLAANVSHKEL